MQGAIWLLRRNCDSVEKTSRGVIESITTKASAWMAQLELGPTFVLPVDETSQDENEDNEHQGNCQ